MKYLVVSGCMALVIGGSLCCSSLCRRRGRYISGRGRSVTVDFYESAPPEPQSPKYNNKQKVSPHSVLRCVVCLQ
jgi:hypothetical protein